MGKWEPKPPIPVSSDWKMEPKRRPRGAGVSPPAPTRSAPTRSSSEQNIPEGLEAANEGGRATFTHKPLVHGEQAGLTGAGGQTGR